VARCLVKDRNRRLQSVAEFAAALLPFSDDDTRRRYAHVGAAISARSPMEAEASHVDAASTAPADAVTRATWSHDRAERSGRARRGAIFLGLGVLAAVAIGSVVALRPGAPASTSSAAASTPLPAKPTSTPEADRTPAPVTAATAVAPPTATTDAVAPSPAPEASARRRSKPPAAAAPKSDPYGQRH
jgi:hypothetical protein